MKIHIAGHQGMVGAALVRRLSGQAGVSLLLRTRHELDLKDAKACADFYAAERPDVVIVAAAKVGGIHANNTYPAEFLFDNLAIATATIDGAYRAGVKRLLFLGSSCIYPKHAPQPMREDCLLTSALEPTNEAYAIAKIAGLKLAQYYRKQYGVLYHSAMPTNLYGPGDNYHPSNSHVLPALISRFHEAKLANAPEVVAWGTGKPMREFLHVDDLADACVHLLSLESPPDWINVGTGQDVTIRELTETVASVVGYSGQIVWDATKPDGTPRKLMDVSLLRGLGWSAKRSLAQGIQQTYAAYLSERASGKLRAV
ncbi:MAG: GDP-L-fucose synthase [Opitutaceae bacterium]|jgi:GDP-L-fucose synthase|nr:GDP-L-fucose synthase [Opitutaceae bacterium]